MLKVPGSEVMWAALSRRLVRPVTVYWKKVAQLTYPGAANV